jgi:pimeloyl-ACP methyl ester carboxylesterase
MNSSKATVEVDGVAVAVETIGRGRESVLFVHGLGANRGCWYRASEYFDVERYRLLMPDFPGFGESARPEDYDYSMATLGQCLAGVVEQFGTDPLHIIAHSMGCVAALAMLQMPGVAVASFVAAEGNLIATDAFMSSKVARLSESTFLRTYSKWLIMVRESLGDQPNEQHDRFVESLRQASPLAVHRASLSCNARTASGELSQQFAQLECPLAYVYGTETEAQRSLPEVVFLPRVERIPVAGQGHFMMQDAEAFYRPIARWIASVG